MITGFHQIRLAAQDTEGAIAAARILFGQAGEALGSARRFALANLDLVVEAGETEGLGALVLQVAALAEAGRVLERRGIPVAMAELEGCAALRLDTRARGDLPILLVEDARTGPPPGIAKDRLEALDHIVVRTPNPDRAAALFGACLGLDLRLDRINPAWRSRLLFFRCGDAVIEVAADPSAPVSDARDAFGGLAWRTRDPDAAHTRLAEAGLDVSEVRDGRKPGSRVFTLRRSLPGGPSLVIHSKTLEEAA